ncbi:HK97 gp10 family phage protein [Novosphingobium sp. BL-8A]|uniref:HK97 gp10 family phage protein n=1 Tax=Novosphingobium sp. BL-8A TaxID=3127639 RepID=UPI003756CA20
MAEAKLRASSWSPKVAAAITKGSARKNQDGTFSIRIYVDERKPDGYLGFFGEYGVAPHLIARTGAKQGRVAVRKAAEGSGNVTLRPMKIGDRFVSGIIHHPGHAAHPFMRVALDTTVDDAIAAFRTKVVAVIENKTGFNSLAGMDVAA